jgi:tRNA pseudouridine38-40 synthase
MLTVAYDGMNYKGFARQPGAVTVEGTLNHCIHALTGEDIEVIGASRTDAGVHALGNVAVFDTSSSIPADRFAPALNRLLPEDIRIVSSREVPDEFHPRHCDSVKTYEYRIMNSSIGYPTDRYYTYSCSYDLDVNQMEAGGSYLIGEHDFTSFCNVQSQARDHVRTIYDLKVVRNDDLVVIVVKGGGFLYNMVRIIAGTLIQVGRGRNRPEDVKKMLEARDRSFAGPTAPPQGLFLIGYDFQEKYLTKSCK